ncbi:MAG: hypothetical protein U5R30_11130 [Deltaproteobacteria bacterium]|nr:hypothetical protein [Deltaproteobacteria bacterium]
MTAGIFSASLHTLYSVTGQKKRSSMVGNGQRSGTICHQRCKIALSCQDEARKKESMAVYNAGSIPSQRTKALAPLSPTANDKTEHHGDKPVKGGRASEVGTLKPASILLILLPTGLFFTRR